MGVRNYSHIYYVGIISNTRFSDVAKDVFSGGGGVSPLAMLGLKTILKCEKDVRFVYTRIFNSQKKFMVY